ncbi:hypothetical protein [Tenggerimyces flavus]|uniref:Metallothionein n=1 Tax=Tenggerimyces flavus TaxID=1708749 RepID=A0ABV7YQU4_9ACTN|nr:hypothetical protein [Tenggerimyces flavus]MBM7786515.1 hypothetical protein [Tenggerimyces flavus]
MPVCDACGNDYDKAFFVTTHDNVQLTFDSVECAAHLIAPHCGHCGCRILGHGVETVGPAIYCCASCAERAGHSGLTDRL